MLHRPGQRWLRFPPIAQLRERLQTLPLSEPEDSVALRVGVQLLVTLGILSLPLASGSGEGTLGITGEALLAIPLSAAGAVWSWYRRRRRNIGMKFVIALGMVGALAIFFSRLLGELNDTRLTLATLLIHLQVLHSFDLPRRKDLGYSMVIGLILLGVAGTVSQTLVFGPVLIAFLAIALPVLVLDYRSRLGLLNQGWQPIRLALPVRRMGLFLLAILAIGLTIFASLPRLPGYQIRTFPVSAPIEFDGEFDGQRIVNPGYVNPGQGSGGFDENGGNGSATTEGAGTLDDTFYYGFNTRINQNLRGSLTPKVLLRIRSQAEGFWRVLAFDRYTGEGWTISRNEDAEILRRSSWSYQFFPTREPTLLPSREVIQTYTVVSEFSNLLPALFEPSEIYFPTEELALDPEGSLRSPVGLQPGLTYTVISEVPVRDRTVLRDAGTVYPETVQAHYLQVPSEIQAAVQEQAEALLSNSPNPLTQPYEQALYLAQALKQNYTIQPDVPFLDEGEDLVTAFLFDHEGGYPDHFATVLTVMLRSIGIPARLVAGFSPGEFNPFTGLYVVRNTDAHALTEVYFPKYGWYAFDPIPGHELIPPSADDPQTFSVLKQFWQWVAGWLPSPVRGFLSTLLGWLSWSIARLSRFFSSGWGGLLAGIGLAVGLGFVGWLSWKGWRAWQYQRWLTSLPPMEQIYQGMVQWLATQGFPKAPTQTPLEYAATCAVLGRSKPAAGLITEISEAYVHWRYGGYAPDLPVLRRKLRQLRNQSKQSPSIAE